MRRVAIAAGSGLAAQAGRIVADAGGNAVDAAIAAVTASMCTDPGIIAPGAGGFIVVWPANDDPVVIDAYAEMPGRGLPPERFGRGGVRISMAYGGGMETIVGYGSVATPGAFAGLGEAHDRYGRLPWREVLAPAVAAVRTGFPLSQPAAEYLTYAHDVIFGWDPDSYATVHDAKGAPLREGHLIAMPDLARTIQTIADEGVDVLYRGELGRKLSAASQAHDGLVTESDLAAYRPISRAPVEIEVGSWVVATNPPPAVGGSCMAAMLLLLDDAGVDRWGAREVDTLAAVQKAVTDYRRDRFDGATDRSVAARRLLEYAALGDRRSLLSAPSTSHTSVVDRDGTACAITVSAGYGSGAMVPGTGFWLNNSLGEVELHPGGYHGLKPGTRLVSNMAPTVARSSDGSILAVGSPGADRITTALSQVLYRSLAMGAPLEEAVAAPRIHVEVFDGEPTVAVEPGLPSAAFEGLTVRPFEALDMYFGGVQAAARFVGNGLVAVADPRRAGGTAMGG